MCSWTLTKTDRKRLEGFEIWMWRRMLKISWKDRVTNVGTRESKQRKTLNEYYLAMRT